MHICVKRYVYRSRVVEQLIEDWKTKQVNGAISPFLTSAISECIDVAALCGQSWQYVRDLIRTDPNGEEIHEAGQFLKPELLRTRTAFNWIQESMAGANETSSTINDAAAFEAASKQVREVSAKIEMVFPELDKEMAEESFAAFERGEYQTIEELIREIQGHRAAAH